jgi:hypothetical protein
MEVENFKKIFLKMEKFVSMLMATIHGWLHEESNKRKMPLCEIIQVHDLTFILKN